jgi:hypothetical protein
MKRPRDPEIAALATILITLKPLAPAARQRVMDYAVRWLADQPATPPKTRGRKAKR